MELIKVWKDQYYVGAYDTDTKGQIKLSRLTGYIQESAWKHASYLDLGASFLHKEKLIWVLSAIKLHIDKYPKWTEYFTVETWPKGLDRLFYLRDFVLKDKNENVIGIATTQWLLLNVKSKRPKIVKTDKLLKVRNTGRNVFEENIIKLPEITGGEIFERELDYMDMDLNNHINSNRYIDIILGTFTKDILQKYNILDFQLNFVKEIKDPCLVQIKRQTVSDNNMYLFEGFSNDTQIKHFVSFIGLL